MIHRPTPPPIPTKNETMAVPTIQPRSLPSTVFGHRTSKSPSDARWCREPSVGARVRRAACSTWRRLSEAAALPRQVQRRSIACSRCRRWPSAKASSFTRLAAFLRCHSPSLTVLTPTETRKPPSSHTRTGSGRSHVAVSGCDMASNPAGGPVPPGNRLHKLFLPILLQDRNTPMNHGRMVFADVVVSGALDLRACAVRLRAFWHRWRGDPCRARR
jgi:hypothetical protein